MRFHVLHSSAPNRAEARHEYETFLFEFMPASELHESVVAMITSILCNKQNDNNNNDDDDDDNNNSSSSNNSKQDKQQWQM